MTITIGPVKVDEVMEFLLTDLIPAALHDLNAPSHEGFSDEESIVEYMDILNNWFTETLVSYQSSKKGWVKAQHEFYALQAAKEPSREKIKAKGKEIDGLYAAMSVPFAVFMDARRAEQLFRCVNSAFTLRSETAVMWLVHQIKSVASYTPNVTWTDNLYKRFGF